MGMSYSLQLAGFCRVMMPLVCVQAEVSPTVPSKRRGFAGCVRQYCYRQPCVQVGVGISEGGLGDRDLACSGDQARGAGRGANLPADGAGRAEGMESIENVRPRLAVVVEAVLAENAYPFALCMAHSG
jgi:hypothetical protein